MTITSYKSAKGKDGIKWQYKITHKGKRYTKGGFETADIAREEATIMLSLLNGNVRLSSKAPLFNDIVRSFFKRYEKTHKNETTYGERTRFYKHVVGVIPNIPIDEITFSILLKWWDNVDSKLSVHYRNHIKAVLIAVFAHADLFYGITNKEVLKLDNLRDFTIVSPKDIVEKKKFLTYEEFKRLISVIEDDYFYLLFLVAFFTGVRNSELRALTIDEYPIKELYVYRRIESKRGKNLTFGTTKTKSSVGRIVVPNFLLEMINEHVKKNDLKIGDFIFFSPYGHNRPISENGIVRRCHLYGKMIGIPNFHLHMLRHSNATLLSGFGVDIEVIKKVLRHSAKEITERYYVHKTLEEEKKVEEILDTFKDDFYK